MRTRSGSLAAIMARVPSHPAHSGVLCICAANASTRSASRRRIPRVQHGRRTASTESPHHRLLQIQGLVGVRSSATSARASILAWVLERWSSTAAAMRTRQLALLPATQWTRAPETQLLEQPQWSITTAMRTGMGSFNDAVGAFALNNNDNGFSNNAMGDSALFRNMAGAANTAVGDLALEDNDSTGQRQCQ